jgi:NADH:ubiquinone oxidoreductase subunit 2 (subunit N)
MKIPEIDLSLIAPEMIITAFGLLALLVGVFSRKGGRTKIVDTLSLIGVILALIIAVTMKGKIGFRRMIISDGFAFFQSGFSDHCRFDDPHLHGLHPEGRD